jgi:uncharacterized cupin superfamily protein
MLQALAIPNVFSWSVWQPDRATFFVSHFFAGVDGGVLIDPLPLDAAGIAAIRERGGAAWILVTNRDHERATAALAAAFGAKIAATAADAPLLSCSIDRILAAGDTIAGGTVRLLAGHKSPGECALHFPETRTALVGDALWGEPAGALRLPPDAKLADPALARRSLLWLVQEDVDTLLVGDGASLFGGASKRVAVALAGSAPFANVVATDALSFPEPETTHPRFNATSAEVGLLIGAQKLGYQIGRIMPGGEFCPYHWHTAEEEFFYVVRGAATLRTPEGERTIAAGDFAAFPVGPSGAHGVRNHTSEPCDILMVANTDRGDTCFYPDSCKAAIEAADLIVPTDVAMTYLHGE